MGAVVLLTVICPVVPPAGAVACSCVDDTWVTVDDGVPLNATLEVPVNPTPVIVTTVVAGPWFGLMPVIDSVGV